MGEYSGKADFKLIVGQAPKADGDPPQQTYGVGVGLNGSHVVAAAKYLKRSRVSRFVKTSLFKIPGFKTYIVNPISRVVTGVASPIESLSYRVALNETTKIEFNLNTETTDSLPDFPLKKISRVDGICKAALVDNFINGKAIERVNMKGVPIEEIEEEDPMDLIEEEVVALEEVVGLKEMDLDRLFY